MATISKIVENAFRIGSGRYIQESGAILKLGEELRKLNCHSPLIIGGKTALFLTKDFICSSLTDAGMQAVFSEYNGFCNPNRGKEIAGSKDGIACDCIVGVGGGNVMDTAKLVAALLRKPVINIPTSSATCAAFTPLSVMYNDRGQTIGSRHHQQEVNVVLADMDILCSQPTRLLVSGIYDSLAKAVESRQRLVGTPEADADIGLLSSYALSCFIYDRLLKDLPTVFNDVKCKKNTKAVYDTVYMTIAATGTISGLARGSNQCAIAHKIYEKTRTLFPEQSKKALHGELVGIGLLPQLVYNGDAEAEPKFRSQMKQVGLPTTLTEIGIPADAGTQNAYYEGLAASSAMAGCGTEELARLKEALKIIF